MSAMRGAPSHDVHERYVRASDGALLYVSVEGSGSPGRPAVVLCDGLGCVGFIWPYLRPSLAARHQVVRWHYRGHGLSSLPPRTEVVEIDQLVRDLGAVMDSLELSDAVLMGHSLGVQVVLEFALQHPERVRGVVTLCGSYGKPLETFHGSGRLGQIFPLLDAAARRFPVGTQTLWTKLLGSELAYQVAVHGGEVNRSLIHRQDFWRYFEDLSSMDARFFFALLRGANGHTVEDRLAALVSPTLVVAGEHDSFTPAWLSERMRDLIPTSELLVVPGGTHVAPLELPELVELRVRRFIEEHTLRPAPKKRAKRTAKTRA